MSRPLVGILGGMGPAAAAWFSLLLVTRTEAACDADHVRTLALNDGTVPDRTAALLGSGPSPAKALAAEARLLARAGCTLLAMPCNTAHAFAETVAAASGLPLISMVEVAAEVCAAKGWRSALVLGTEGTVASGLYGRALERRGLRAAYPDAADQQALSALIYEEVKAGRHAGESWGDTQPQAAADSRGIAGDARRRAEGNVPSVSGGAVAAATGRRPPRETLAQLIDGNAADGVLIACTELSLLRGLGEERAEGALVIDALACLADAVIEAAGARTRSW